MALFKRWVLDYPVTRTPRHHHITPVLKSLHWLKIPERIHFKVLSLTCNSLQSSQPTYLHQLFTIRGNPLYSIIILSHPFSTPVTSHLTHVLQLSHIHHCTTSLEWPTTWAPHHFFTFKTVIANHKTSSSSGSSICHPPGAFHSILKCHLFKHSYPDPSDHSFTLPIWTTPTLTATLSPSGILEIGPELLLTPFGKPPFDSSQRSWISWCPRALSF